MPISDEQLAFNQALHQSNPAFGSRDQAAGMAATLPLALYRTHESGFCSSVLDYGTGKGLLVDRLRAELPPSIRVDGYDPAIQKWSQKPSVVPDIVLCLDVLEHVELHLIDSVIADICSLTRHFCYIVVDLQPAVKYLPDGRNAHILLAPAEWWVSRFSQFFPCLTTLTLKHKNGCQQKVVIVAAHEATTIPHMHVFLNKLNVYTKVFKGGKMKKC